MARRAIVIAEFGSNHAGDIADAKELCLVAKECGADIAKGQYWSSAKRLAERRGAGNFLAVYERYEMPKWWLAELHDYCKLIGIEFLCTVYLPEDIEIIAQYVKRFKISSFEALDKAFFNLHRKYKKPILISSGMLDETTVGLEFGDEDVLMHCTSAYPCPDDQANIAACNDWLVNGYSDHTKNPLSGALAFAHGADYIETHFRLDTTSPDCPDYAVSKTPAELKQYIDNIRQAEILLGDGVKKVQPAEEANLKYRVK